MKTINILMAIILSSILLILGCKKDDINDSKKYEYSKLKNNAKIEKDYDEMDLAENLAQFINDIYDGVDPEERDGVEGLLYIESALNYLMVSHERAENSYIRKTYEEPFALMYEPTDLIAGETLASLYHDIYEVISVVADTATIGGEEDADAEKFVSAIDISFDESNLNNGDEIIIAFTLGWYHSNITPVPCTTDGDYYILHQSGCDNYNNKGTRLNENANEQVTRLINAYCYSGIDRCENPPFAPLWYRITTIPLRSNYSNPDDYDRYFNFYTTPDISECVKESEIIHTVDSIKAHIADQYPDYSSLPPVTVKEAYTINWSWFINMNNNHNQQQHSIKLIKITGVCIGGPVSLPTTHTPPIWLP